MQADTQKTALEDQIKRDAARAAEELCRVARLERGALVVVGCSSSEMVGSRIGTESSPSVAEAFLEGVLSVLEPRGIFLAAQCCEHLNRALVVEREALPLADPVNAVPQPKAGGSFATAAYRRFAHPMLVEHIRADAGLDVGSTLIGMHLREVAVPVRLSVSRIGEAPLVAARTRPKFVGGCRAVYDETLL